MNLSKTSDPEQNQLRATERWYRRAGYKVIVPSRGDTLPLFLEGLSPDLVAEREDDHVVVEIKRADKVAGSNDLIPLAERVAGERGWRCEFISVPAPVHVELLSEGPLDDDVFHQLLEQGAFRAAFLLKYAEMENVVSWAAASNKVSFIDNLLNMARDLVTIGVLSSDVLRDVGHAASIRNKLVHGVGGKAPSEADVLELERVADRLRSGLLDRETA